MDVVEGAAQGYYHEPVAMVGNVSTPARKRTSHYFAGPDHSVIHPGLFPHNPKAILEVDDDPLEGGLATMAEWLLFDHKAVLLPGSSTPRTSRRDRIEHAANAGIQFDFEGRVGSDLDREATFCAEVRS